MQGITGILDIKIKEHRQTCLATTKTCVVAALRGCSGFRQWTFCASKLTKILLPIINKLEVLLHRDAVKILAEEFQKDYGLGREQKIRLLSVIFQSSQDFQSKCHDSCKPFDFGHKKDAIKIASPRILIARPAPPSAIS